MKADILSLASVLAAAQSDGTTLSAYYDDAMIVLAKASWFVDVELVPLVSGQAVVNPPVGTVRVHALCYDDSDLAPTAIRDFESLSVHWRDLSGKPYAYTQESETTETFRMVPIPTVPSKPFSFIHGEPLGVDYPAYVVATFVSVPPVDVPRWMDLPLAFGLLAREFGRDSAHADPAFSSACSSFGQMLLGTVSLDAS